MSLMVTVTEPARRFEVLIAAGQQRRWTLAEKAQIVEESFSGRESVCALARRQGLASTQLFAWCKEALHHAAETSFVPVLMEVAQTPVVLDAPKKRRCHSRNAGSELRSTGWRCG